MDSRTSYHGLSTTVFVITTCSSWSCWSWVFFGMENVEWEGLGGSRWCMVVWSCFIVEKGRKKGLWLASFRRVRGEGCGISCERGEWAVVSIHDLGYTCILQHFIKLNFILISVEAEYHHILFLFFFQPYLSCGSWNCTAEIVSGPTSWSPSFDFDLLIFTSGDYIGPYNDGPLLVPFPMKHKAIAPESEISQNLESTKGFVQSIISL